MLELFRNLTDDQFAILGCIGAMLGASFLLSGSYHFGVKTERNTDPAILQDPAQHVSESRKRAA